MRNDFVHSRIVNPPPTTNKRIHCPLHYPPNLPPEATTAQQFPAAHTSCRPVLATYLQQQKIRRAEHSGNASVSIYDTHPYTHLLGQKRVSGRDISVKAGMATRRRKKRTTHPLRAACAKSRARKIGAGEGNRTLLVGLGSRCITTMLRPPHLTWIRVAATLSIQCHAIMPFSKAMASGFDFVLLVTALSQQSQAPDQSTISACRVSRRYPPLNRMRFAPMPTGAAPAHRLPVAARAQWRGTTSHRTSAHFRKWWSVPQRSHVVEPRPAKFAERFQVDRVP